MLGRVVQTPYAKDWRMKRAEQNETVIFEGPIEHEAKELDDPR
jgi:hypothetical protein